MVERIKPIPIESLQLKQGSHAYLLKDENLGVFENKKRPTLEEVQTRIEQEAQFIGAIRQQIEAQGGRFNGIRILNVDIPNPDYMRSGFSNHYPDYLGPTSPHRLTFVLADYP